MKDERLDQILEIVRDQIYTFGPKGKFGLYQTILESNIEFEDSTERHESLTVALIRLTHSGEIVKQPDRFYGESYGVPDDFVGRDEALAKLGFAPLKTSKKGKK